MGLAFLITTEKLQLLGERKVLKEAEYAALLDAAAVVDAARVEARRIVQQARAEAADLLKQGYDEGVQQARTEHAQRMLSEAAASQRQLQALRGAMAQVVMQSVQQFVLETDPAQLLEAALLRVDALIRSEPFVTVRVAPAEEALTRAVLERVSEEQNWGMGLSIVADPALPDGHCLLQTPSGTLELGVDAQLEAFRRTVERQGGPGFSGAAP